MLRSYGPGCDGSIIEAAAGRIPDGVTWIDLEEPTREEEKLVEQCVGVNVPTEEELAEIEPSSRLYEREGALYMTISVLCGVECGVPTTTPIGFVLADRRLVTIRYATPKPFRAFANHVHREPALARNSSAVLVGLLDSIIDRLADELESLNDELEAISAQIFRANVDERRIPVERLKALLTRIGRSQTLLAKIRYSTVSTVRMLSFLGATTQLHKPAQKDALRHLASLATDATSLSEHSNFLADNVQFLLDASLGLISIEQNAAMKLFSWAAVVFLPPTLIAGVYGMNFEHMPELDWRFGYPLALALILVSAVTPFLYFKKRGWI